MQIIPTLIITSSSIGEEVFNKFRTDLITNYGERSAELMMKKCSMLTISGDLFFENEKKEILLRNELSENHKNFTVSEYFQHYTKYSEEIFGIINNSISRIRDTEVTLQLNHELYVEDGHFKTNIIVLLPLYKPAESTLLTFLISGVFKKLGVVDFHFNVIGLLPELETDLTSAEITNYQIRTYTCITEC